MKLSCSPNQKKIIVSLLIGYAGYYFCRSNLSVVAPLLLKEFSSQGLDKIMLGSIVSSGVLFYAIGKIINGVLGDIIGGKTAFILGMIGSVFATIFFGISSGIAMFTLFWVINRYVQSIGWSALLKTVSLWFRHTSYARIMGILSLSFLFGDAMARWFFGWLLSFDIGWRGIFYSAALVLGVLMVINIILLPKKNPSKNLSISVHPKNCYTAEAEKVNVKQLLLPIIRNPSFWMVIIMSIGLTLIRETFNFWIPTYFTEVLGSTVSDAAKFSILFPFFGGISVICYGLLTDLKMNGKKSIIIIISLILLSITLLMLTLIDNTVPKIVHLLLISLSAFLIIGPYSFLAGAMSLDLGGKRGSSTVGGLVDSAGYFGATISGIGVAKIVSVFGWNKVFMVLTVVSVLMIFAASKYRQIFEENLAINK